MSKFIPKGSRMSHNECRLSPYAFPDDELRLKLGTVLREITVDKYGSSIWFDKWMIRNFGVWRMGDTDRLVSGKEERTNEFWLFLDKCLFNFTIWAKEVLRDGII